MTVSWGSENPSEENAINSRASSRSRAARSVRRRLRRSWRTCRDSLGNTEHLPVAEGPRPFLTSGKADVIPATVNSVDRKTRNGLPQLPPIRRHPLSTPRSKERRSLVYSVVNDRSEVARIFKIRAGRGLVVNDVTSRSDIAFTTPLPVGPLG